MSDLITVDFAERELVVELYDPATAAQVALATASAAAAGLAASSAVAAGRYFTSQAAGEAGSTTGQFFSHPDGAGGLVYREKTGGGSTIIAYAATTAQVNGKVATADLASGAAGKGAGLVMLRKLRPGAQDDTIDNHAQQFLNLHDYLPANKRADARAGIDTTTDHSVYLQGMIDDGAVDIDLGYGKLNLKTPIVTGADARWRGRRLGTVLRSSVNGRVLTTTASGHRLAMEDFVVVGDLALVNSGFAELFDPATAHIKNVDLSNFNKAGFKFVQGVLIAVSDCDMVNCGDVSEAAVWFDPGVTATVVAIIERCYLAASATALKATLCRALRIDDSVFESNGLATDLDRCDGLISNSWFEANAIDGAWADCTGLQRLKVSSTNAAGGIWNKTWPTAQPSEKGIVNGYVGFGEMLNDGDRTVAATATWTDVLFSASGSAYLINPRAGGAPALMQTAQPGWHEAAWRIPLRATTANARNGSLRCLHGGKTLTMTIATPGVVNCTAHGLVAGDKFVFSTTGALPTGATPGATYFALASGLTANTFQFSATSGGAAINTSGSQSGTHTLWREIPGSEMVLSVPASATKWLVGSIRVHLAIDEQAKLQWSADNTDLYISRTGVSGIAAASVPTDAYFSLRHLGAER